MTEHILRPTAVLELVGKDDEVNTSDWGNSVAFTLRPDDVSGEILAFTLITRKDSATGSTGVILTPTGKLFVFDTDPVISAGDTALASGVHDSILGTVELASGSWYADIMAGTVYSTTLVPFFNLKILYFAWFHEAAGDINDASGDDEIMEMIFSYKTLDR